MGVREKILYCQCALKILLFQNIRPPEFSHLEFQKALFTVEVSYNILCKSVLVIFSTLERVSLLKLALSGE